MVVHGRANGVRCGHTGYKVTKVRDPETQRMGLLFQIMLPEIKQGERPRKRFMSSFEQHREPVNRAVQYFLVRWLCYDFLRPCPPGGSRTHPSIAC